MVKLAPPGTIAQQVGVKRRKIPEAPTLSKEELVKRQGESVKKAQQEFVKKETAKVDRLISEYHQEIADYNKYIQASIKKYGGKGSENRAKLNQLDDDISFAKRQIRGLERGKKYITRGASYADVTSYAAAKASAELANIAATQQVSYQAAEEGKIYYNPKTDIYYAKDPTTGKVTLTSGQRGLEFFQERLGVGASFKVTKAEAKKINVKLAEARFKEGLKTFEPTAPTTIISTKPTAYFKPSEETYIPSMRMFARPSEPSAQATALFRTPTIEEQRRIDLTFGEKTEALETKWFGPKERLTKEEYEKLRFKPIPKEERPWFAPSKIRGLFETGAEYTFKVGEKAAGVFEKTGIIKPDSKLFEPSGITREGAKSLIADIYMFGGFGRFMRTGTAQRMESQYAGEVVEVTYKGQKVRMTKAEAKRLGLVGTRQQAVGEFGRMTEEKQIQILRRAFIKKREGVFYLDRATKEAAIVKDIGLAKKFMRESGLSESQVTARINILFPRMVQQQMLIIESTGAIKLPTKLIKPKIKLKPKVEKQQLFFKELQVPKVAQMKKIAFVESAVVTPSRLKMKAMVAFKPISIQKTKLDVKQEFITETLQIQKRKPVFGMPTIKTTIQPSRIGRTPSKAVWKPSPKIPKKPKIKLWFVLPGLALPKDKKKQQGYIPQAKTKGGKWMSLSKKPMSRGAALSRGARATDQTLSAQFRIRKTKGKITNGYDNYFGVTQQKFRPYKIRKGKAIELHNQFIEKRGARLDQRGEVEGLKLAKFVKQQGWTKKKKVKKKKKIVGIK